MSTPAPAAPYRHFWVKLPVAVGNLVQLAGLVLGAGIIALAAALRSTGPLATLLLLVGLIVIYVCRHAVVHW